MTSETETSAAPATASATGQSPLGGLLTIAGRDMTLPAMILAGLTVSILLVLVAGGTQPFPESVTQAFPMVEWVNQAEKWLQEHLRWFTRAVSEGVGWALDGLEETLLSLPWPVVMLGLTLPALAYGGLRLGLITVFGVWFWAAVDMWDVAMSTLSLMSVSVLLCVAIGLVLGVICSQSDRFEAALRPALDAMQVMPAFVYLVPAIFFFGIGGPSAAMAILIYALPPIIRLTNLGIRQVPPGMVEAARSFGTSPTQMLIKVQIPQAMPSIMLGVNQTIMMALALAVLATFIGAEGLGAEVWRAISRLRVGQSFEGGLCIVFMAIIFDRLSYAMSKTRSPFPPDQLEFRLLPQSWDENPVARAVESIVDKIWRAVGRVGMALTRAIASVAGSPGGRSAPAHAWCLRHPFLICGAVLIVATLFVDTAIVPIGDYPRDWEISIRKPIDQAIDALTVYPPFIAITQAIRTGVYLYLLNPLDKFLIGLPWWYVIGVLALVIWRLVGWRFALVAVACLFFVGAAGLWEITMYTLAGTAVSVVICMILGIPLGVFAAYSKTWDAIQRPILDTMQVMPAFVYLIPALFFFGGNPTTAIIATVIYALPPMIRMTTLGLSQVPTEIEEVSRSFGASSIQTLIKAKLPLATPSIMLGVNQTVVMALAMQAVTPLVAGLGLGKEVYDAMNTLNTGQGLMAGIGIAILAIVLDQLTQAWTKTQRAALGLA
ncbi:MAG: ABC transporter permease subunit [Pseudomonadota bacterium]